MVEYTEPAPDGTVECPEHPGTRFMPFVGCQHADHANCPPDADADPGADAFEDLAEAAREAAEAGLPNALDYERVALAIRSEAEKEIGANRKIARLMERVGQAMLQNLIPLTVEMRIDGESIERPATPIETQREAREWLKAATGSRGNIRALIAESGKVNGKALAAASVRDSDAKVDRRNREGALAKQRRGHN